MLTGIIIKNTRDIDRSSEVASLTEERQYSYEIDIGDESISLEPYKHGVNAFIRWRKNNESGKFGGITERGELALDIREYMKSIGKTETYKIPEETLPSIQSELRTLRDEVIREASGDEAEEMEEHRELMDRAKEILQEEGVPSVGTYDFYEFERNNTQGENKKIQLRAKARNGVAEITVKTDTGQGYSPKYDLSNNKLTLPPIEPWGLMHQIELPEGIAKSLLDDLKDMQKELNEKKERYDDAVMQAREEIENE